LACARRSSARPPVKTEEGKNVGLRAPNTTGSLSRKQRRVCSAKPVLIAALKTGCKRTGRPAQRQGGLVGRRSHNAGSWKPWVAIISQDRPRPHLAGLEEYRQAAPGRPVLGQHTSRRRPQPHSRWSVRRTVPARHRGGSPRPPSHMSRQPVNGLSTGASADKAVFFVAPAAKGRIVSVAERPLTRVGPPNRVRLCRGRNPRRWRTPTHLSAEPPPHNEGALMRSSVPPAWWVPFAR
jgi:hypothetical protein